MGLTSVEHIPYTDLRATTLTKKQLESVKEAQHIAQIKARNNARWESQKRAAELDAQHHQMMLEHWTQQKVEAIKAGRPRAEWPDRPSWDGRYPY